jgi:hypothetical protein
MARKQALPEPIAAHYWLNLRSHSNLEKEQERLGWSVRPRNQAIRSGMKKKMSPTV